MSQDWDWASVRCPKCGKVLDAASTSRAEELAMCPECGDLFCDDVGAKANGPPEKPVKVIIDVKAASKRPPNR
jgi:ribosomal protein S27E